MSTFEKCGTKAEATTLLDELCTEPRSIIGRHKAAFRERCKVIREQELYPFHLLAKQFQPGDKVYFGKSDMVDWFDLNTLKMSPNYTIKQGAWCYVWKYQPKAKRLWLCHPGKKCIYSNIIDHAFGLSEIQRLEILRTELAIRQ